MSEKDEYETLTAKLHTSILSHKYSTKAALKSMEMGYIAKRGLQLDTSNPEYNRLLKKLGLLKKILSVWSQFKAWLFVVCCNLKLFKLHSTLSKSI